MNAPVKVQIIHTPSGDALAVLPLADYEALLAAAEMDEEILDSAIFDARMQEIEAGSVPHLPAEVSMDLLRGVSRLAALRRWRGLSQKELAARAGIAQGFLSDIERRRRVGAAETIDRLAAALDVTRAWLD
jgi:DNA-binding XRE family transcriptional regulator